MTIVIECGYEPAHTHEYPDDWQFGGANALDPRADPRWRPTTYEYYDANLRVVHLTQVPLCDDEALEKFTDVARYGPGFVPVFLRARRPGERAVTLPWNYDKSTDTLHPA